MDVTRFTSKSQRTARTGFVRGVRHKVAEEGEGYFLRWWKAATGGPVNCNSDLGRRHPTDGEGGTRRQNRGW